VIGLVLAAASTAAVWIVQPSGSTAELRGLAVLDARHAWTSGSGGTVLRTQDGENWVKLAVPGGDELDFRDVEALSGEVVVLMAAGPGDRSRVYRSADGGRTWALVHTNPDKEGFYDAIAFWDEKNGIVMGDPVGGRFVVRVTGDGGATWAEPPGLAMPGALSGAGAVGARGSCLFALKGGRDAWFVTGGAKVARVFHTSDRGRTWAAAEAPVPTGNPSSGLFSIAFLDARRGFTVGGDYKQPAFRGLDGARTDDGGATWTPAPVAAAGFYSAVVPVPGSGEELIAVGLAGTAVSRDGGRTWEALDAAPFNAVAFAGRRAGWAVGPKGAVARFRKAE
jgi:photosystem II stability/assembly factor-like uncharacterized protein